MGGASKEENPEKILTCLYDSEFSNFSQLLMFQNEAFILNCIETLWEIHINSLDEGSGTGTQSTQ